MRERMDFCSISKIILDNKKEGCLSNTGYYLTLFDYAFRQSDIIIIPPEDGNISKVINGVRSVVGDIITLYQWAGNQKYLLEGVTKVLEDTSDTAYIGEQLGNLLWNDITISQAKKKELSKGEKSIEQFVTDCLLFGMSRKFISREEKAETHSGRKSFCLSEFLLDYHFPSVNSVFLGREKDLIAIRERLDKTSSLLLEGIGGIGKSELAKQYGKRYKSEYEHVIFIRYTESLKRTITELEFVGDNINMSEEDLFRNHYRFFKQLPDSVLVILDNFDTVPEYDELFHEFVDMSFTLLVTTRSHIEEVESYLVEEIPDMNKLMELFYTYAPVSRDVPLVVMDIIEEVYRHTLTVEIAAKTLTASGMEPQELLSALRREGVVLSNPNKVKVKKDSRTKKERLYGHLQTLFRLQELSRVNRDILMNMVLTPDKGLEKGLFHHWMRLEDFNHVNELVEFGWIQEDTERCRIGLHPFLREVIAGFEKPSIRKCGTFLSGIFLNCISYGVDMSYYHDVLNTIEMIFRYIEIDDTSSAYLFMDSALSYMEKYRCVDAMKRILDIMEETIPMDEEHKREHAVYLLYRGGIEHRKDEFQKAKAYWEEAVDVLGDVNRTYADIQNNLYHNLSLVYYFEDAQKSWELEEKARKIRERYGLPFNQDAIIQTIHWAILLAGRRKEKKAVDTLKTLERKYENEPFFDTTMAEIYKGLGIVMSTISPIKAMEYLKKAKERYLLHFPMDDEQVREVEKAIKMIQLQTCLIGNSGFIRLQ